MGHRSKQNNVKLRKLLQDMEDDGQASSKKNPNEINLMYQPNLEMKEGSQLMSPSSTDVRPLEQNLNSPTILPAPELLIDSGGTLNKRVDAKLLGLGTDIDQSSQETL